MNKVEWTWHWKTAWCSRMNEVLSKRFINSVQLIVSDRYLGGSSLNSHTTKMCNSSYIDFLVHQTASPSLHMLTSHPKPCTDQTQGYTSNKVQHTSWSSPDTGFSLQSSVHVKMHNTRRHRWHHSRTPNFHPQHLPPCPHISISLSFLPFISLSLSAFHCISHLLHPTLLSFSPAAYITYWASVSFSTVWTHTLGLPELKLSFRFQNKAFQHLRSTASAHRW